MAHIPRFSGMPMQLSQVSFNMLAVTSNWMAIIILGVVLSIYRYKAKGNPKGLPLPPGPTPLPIIGNSHQAPKDREWIRYTEWFGEYGIISVQSIIVNVSTEILFRASCLLPSIPSTRHRDQYPPGSQRPS